MIEIVLLLILASSFIYLIYLHYSLDSIEGNKSMKKYAKSIRKGSLNFLQKEFKALRVILIGIGIFLFVFVDLKETSFPDGPVVALVFLLGGILSFLSGKEGVKSATIANLRTAQALRTSIFEGLKMAFSSGAVLGMTTVSLSLTGVAFLYFLTNAFHFPSKLFFLLAVVFSLGASLVALFARVAGGIFTKAADIGADLVGKVEKNFHEDDSRNPLVIADNVGDNVGDVAGMGADLFESYVGTLVATMLLARFLPHKNILFFPLIIAALGILSSGFAIAYVRKSNVKYSLLFGFFIASTLSIILFFGASILLFPGELGIRFFFAIFMGMLAGVFVSGLTSYYTSGRYKIVQKLVKDLKVAAPVGIIKGLSIGYSFVLWQSLFLGVVIFISYYSAEFFGIALASLGMLGTLAFTLALDAFGPVADDAAAIAEVTHMPRKIRKKAEYLDELGNSSAAIGKGFAISSGALTSLSLFLVFFQGIESFGLGPLKLTSARLLIGLLIGGSLPFIFSSLTLRSVNILASSAIKKARKQFHKKKDYQKLISFLSKGAIHEMILPGMIALISPILVYSVLGYQGTAGLLVGSLISGIPLASSMAITGAAWDNAKKTIESEHAKKAQRDSAVIADTIGDPLKDTSGPSLNILLKIMGIVALIILVL